MGNMFYVYLIRPSFVLNVTKIHIILFHFQALDQQLSVVPTTSSDVKSSAVVKYSSIKIPVQFSTIRLNTDLNHPPTDRQQAGCFMFGEQPVPGAASFSPFNR